jgi:hypothetical protein
MKRRKKRGPPRSKTGNLVALLLVLLVLAGLPLAVVAYQSHRTGMTWSQVLQRIFARSSPVDPAMVRTLPEGERIDFLESVPIGNPGTVPRISNLQVVDLDRDGLLDVVVCDAEANSVSWIRQSPRGVFEEHVCASDIMAPAHVQAVDFDHDGDLDLVVAVLGMLFPNNDPIGSVVILENTGEMRFSRHVVVENVARVSDVRAGDLDGDGDLDLAVAQFGYDDGESRWIENLGEYRFRSHILQTLSGPVNCEIVDINGDGSLDIILLVSQEWEEIYVFLNGGQGDFEPRLIYGATNEDFGSSGMSLCDLDQDGDLDILYTNGDAFDYIPPRPRPWHGVQWLENRGGLEFIFHRLADVPGAYGARPLDVDHDGDLDLFVVSAFNFWENPESVSFLWLENDGTQTFRVRDIASTPTHLLCLETGDFDGDGEVDFVSGGMHVYSPYDRMSRVRLWKNRWPAATEKP